LLALWGLALLAYANSFRSGLVFDNYFAIAEDARIRHATSGNVQLILTQSYWYQTSTSALYRPLTTLSYLFNYAILGNGVAPAGYHWVNFALHAANIALVYLLGLLLLGEFAPALAMAAIWAVHPVLTESVTNIVGRADLLAGFGVLAGIVCYAGSVRSRGRRAGLWLGALLAASTIGIFSKESGVVVMAAVFLYDVAYCRSAPLRFRVYGYLAAAVPVAGFLFARSKVLAGLPAVIVPFTDNPLVGLDFWTARLTAVKVLGKYLWLLVWPGHLSCDYSYNQIPPFAWRFTNWEDWKAILALAVCAGAAALAVFCYRRSKPVLFFIAFFFAALAPTANLALLIGTIMAERFLYLPAIGFAGCLAWAGWAGFRRLRTRWPAARVAAPAVLAMLTLALCARTFARNADWFDERSLWTSAARWCPDSYKTHHHLATILSAEPANDLDGASREIERALAILKPLPDEQSTSAVYATAGAFYRLKGDAAQPGDRAAWYRRSIDILSRGRDVDSAWEREMARRNRQEGKTVGPVLWPPLYLELGRTYRSLGQYQKALDVLAIGSWINPQAAFFEEMAANSRALGDPNQAAIALMEGLTMDSDDQGRLVTRVMELYRQTAPESCALTGSGAAARVNFDCPLVHNQLCTAGRNVAMRYVRLQRKDEALAIATSAVRSLGCPAEMFR
jgi:tetratricopeptide (TPR) repeat protein